ncbi:MAG: hypothetical protein ACYDAE_04305 [Steroidobacteraceae bacterium]
MAVTTGQAVSGDPRPQAPGLTGVCALRAVRGFTRRCAASWILMALALMLARPAQASQPLEGVLACRKIVSGAARLACFDRESAVIAAHVATITGRRPPSSGPPAKAAEAATPRVALAGAAAAHGSALDPVQTFGLPEGQILAREEAAQRAPRPLEHIEAHIVGLAGMGDGREIFTLDNDQVWAELEPDGDLYAKPGETVEISRGWLGSYMLRVKSRRSSKVTRLH